MTVSPCPIVLEGSVLMRPVHPIDGNATPGAPFLLEIAKPRAMSPAWSWAMLAIHRQFVSLGAYVLCWATVGLAPPGCIWISYQRTPLPAHAGQLELEPPPPPSTE